MAYIPEVCSRCEGKGKIKHKKKVRETKTRITTEDKNCRSCNGKGKILKEQKPKRDQIKILNGLNNWDQELP